MCRFDVHLGIYDSYFHFLARVLLVWSVILILIIIITVVHSCVCWGYSRRYHCSTDAMYIIIMVGIMLN